MKNILIPPLYKRGKIIHIFGNPLLPFDSLPIKLKSELEKQFPDVKFIIKDPNENLKPFGNELAIIDTIANIKEVIVIDDLNMIKTDNIYSLHDFDLGFNLKLLQKIGKLKKIKIFGVPMGIDESRALEQLTKLIGKYITI